jgi:molybdate transport system permease protein
VLVAGNIPGRTQTLALAIFSDLQSGDDRRALWLVGLTVVLAFAAVYAVEGLLRRRPVDA